MAKVILRRHIKNSEQSQTFPMSKELFRFFIEWFYTDKLTRRSKWESRLVPIVLKKPFTAINLKAQLEKYMSERNDDDSEYESVSTFGIESKQSRDMLKALIKLKKADKVGWNNDIPPPLISLIKDFVSKAKPDERLWVELKY